MPIYGYRCGQCGHELEVFQSMADEPLQVCSECGGALHKLLYPVGVHFKGSGFYTTDYKGNGSASRDGSGGSGTTSSSEKQPEPVGEKGS
ncbi:MAG TPA: FmdB family zinc ribbon protein [Candidatus Dormibacteraeota bacterium]|nr:FmdB family zinc ribbon protein [Candidatus Dormibacteraeota bacterium]